ncbi:MAG: iron-containing alcohol dehydrogenase [Defluviitaleaceae bacterium]|nr:iron-containing alcohol dehydrogenase [Defluviitaleaceae bacterium]
MFQTINVAVPNVVFGMDSVQNVGQEAAKLGSKRALLLSGPNIEKSGSLEAVAQSLRGEGIECVVRIEARSTVEPTAQSAEEVAAFAKDEGTDCVIGFGGGSVMDVAKMASALVTNPGRAADYFGIDKIPKRGLPTIMIPTTSGTGTEVTRYAVLLDAESNVKKVAASKVLLPSASIIDPKLTVSCPPSVTANTGIDAFMHVAEPFVSTLANPITDSMAISAMEMISKWIGKAYAKGDDLNARYYMSMGSLMSGIIMNNTGTSIVHALSYPIGGEFHINHGRALTPIMRACFEFIMPAVEDKFYIMAKALGEKVDHLSTREGALLCLDALEHMCERLELPTRMEDAGITDKSGIDRWAVDAYAERRLLSRSARDLTVEDIKKIYHASFRN